MWMKVKLEVEHHSPAAFHRRKCSSEGHVVRHKYLEPQIIEVDVRRVVIGHCPLSG